MTIDVYTSAGTKKGTWELPKELFEAAVNQGLIHQAVTMQQGNRRSPIARAKSRAEVLGSTKKMFAQKHTGRARRGPGRSPLLKGGGKAFGPKSDRNFSTSMPKEMRHSALRACLSFLAQRKAIIGLESYPETIKTKDASALLKKLPVELGRKIVLVIPVAHKSLMLSVRNIPNVKTLLASYLNPEDMVGARSVIFLAGSLEKAQEIFGKKKRERSAGKNAEVEVVSEKKPTKPKTPKKPKSTAKKASPSA
jgi:large subunit ribosomal protein L4